MRKRILGAAVLFCFIVSLTAASNIKKDAAVREVPVMEGLAAGSIRFAHSFTPESDEKTGIEKKETMIVTSAYDDDLMQEKIRTKRDTDRRNCTGKSGSAGNGDRAGNTAKPLEHYFNAGRNGTACEDRLVRITGRTGRGAAGGCGSCV